MVVSRSTGHWKEMEARVRRTRSPAIAGAGLGTYPPGTRTRGLAKTAR
jgi:hypothetical protein